LTANTTCPSGVRLHVVNGATIRQTGSFTLTINCAIDAPPLQIFSGFFPRQIAFSGDDNRAVWGEWFGASPSAACIVNANAIQSLIEAVIGGPEAWLGAGSFLVCGSGTPSGSNGAAIIDNYTTNLTHGAISLWGRGHGVTTLKLANSNYFNIIEVVDTTAAFIPFPFSLHGLTLDGNGANNPQQAAGDRYQNCFYGQTTSQIDLTDDVECIHGSYHGIAWDAVKYSRINALIHNNYSDGLLLTGNPEGGDYGTNNFVHVTSYSNGNNDINHKVDTSDNACVIIAQKNSQIHCVTNGNNQPVIAGSQSPNPFPGGAYLAVSEGNTVEIVSNNDNVSLYLDRGTKHNHIILVVTQRTQRLPKNTK
jgi:hypothetical protein